MWTVRSAYITDLFKATFIFLFSEHMSNISNSESIYIKSDESKSFKMYHHHPYLPPDSPYSSSCLLRHRSGLHREHRN